MFAGVWTGGLKAHAEGRGNLTEVYSDAWGLLIMLRQWSIVHSRALRLRGMHLQRRHDESPCIAADQGTRKELRIPLAPV